MVKQDKYNYLTIKLKKSPNGGQTTSVIEVEREIAHDVWLATKCIDEVKVTHNFIESDTKAYSIGILVVKLQSLFVTEVVRWPLLCYTCGVVLGGF